MNSGRSSIRAAIYSHHKGDRCGIKRSRKISAGRIDREMLKCMGAVNSKCHPSENWTIQIQNCCVGRYTQRTIELGKFEGHVGLRESRVQINARWGVHGHNAQRNIRGWSHSGSRNGDIRCSQGYQARSYFGNSCNIFICDTAKHLLKIAKRSNSSISL